MFLRFGLVALFPACAAAFLAARNGYHSPPALALGVCALVLAAPCAACAGGASLPGMGLLVLLLLPFFAWRTTRLGTALRRDGGLTRAALRQRGLVEALLALGWTAVAVGLVHLLA
jgi:hypothetical protein